MSPPPPLSAPVTVPLSRLLGLATAALAVFLVELTLMRAVAQVTWPPFAFLALSAAMLGGGLAGTALVLAPKHAQWRHLPMAGALVVAAGAPLSLWAVLRAGLEPLRLGLDVGASAIFIAVLLTLTLPFVGLALSLSSLLLVHPTHAHRLYGADLVGAALGSFLSVWLLDVVGAAGAGAVGGVLGALAALQLADTRPARAIAVVAAVIGALLVPVAQQIVPRPTVDKVVGTTPARDVLQRLHDSGKLHVVDGADGRIDVMPASPPALLIDLGAAVTRAPIFPSNTVPRDPASAGFIAKSPVDGDVLIVGSGGGFEVARALQHGARHVDAVEVSSSVLTAATDGSIPSSAAVYKDPRVVAHLEEARSFLEQQDARSVDGRPRTWRHIVAVHTISNAAVTVNAMRLAEDFLLTRESMHTLLRHLDDDGVLYMTRPAGQIDLLADLARDGLRGVAGIDTAQIDHHLAELVRDVDDPFFRGLLVSRVPLNLATLQAPPGHHWQLPPAPTSTTLPTDERPFFHRQSHMVDDDADARLRIEGPALAERALLQVGALSVLLSLVVVVLPLLWRRRRLADHGTDRRSDEPPATHLAIAALLGLAFMCLELSLAQRLTLTCGRPAVAFAAVVGGMLLGGGLAGLFVAGGRTVSLTTALALSTLGAVASTTLPLLFDVLGVLAWSSLARAAVVAVGAAIVSAPLGLCFPGLVMRTAQIAPTSAPWLYGLNATMSVGATALHAGLAPLTGLFGTTLLAACCYGVAALLAWRERVPQGAGGSTP